MPLFENNSMDNQKTTLFLHLSTNLVADMMCLSEQAGLTMSAFIESKLENIVPAMTEGLAPGTCLKPDTPARCSVCPAPAVTPDTMDGHIG
jgi:hypothetical protein